MNDTVNIEPSPRVLRMLGQIDFAPWQCLAELIDNSIDAFINQKRAGQFVSSSRIIISLPNESQLKSGNGVVKISDTGPGMGLTELGDSVKAGYSGNDPVEKMGLFGMGFNISTARLGRKTEVWTTKADAEDWIGLIIDFDELEKKKSFDVPVQTKKKSVGEMESGTHGTEIAISSLERERIQPLMRGQGKSRTKQKLGKIYGRIMSELDINISYDGDKIVPWKHCTWNATRTVQTEKFGNVNARLEILQELPNRRFCSTCWIWLNDIDENCTSCGNNNNVIDRKRTLKGWIGVQRYFDKKHFGIDLIRNGRVIEELDKSLFTFKDSTGDEMLEYPIDATHWGGRIVGELDIDFVRVSHQKDSFDKLDPEWRHVVSTVRGESPIQPKVAERLNFPNNTSPLAKLFSGYRYGKAGLKNLVPGDAKGRGINTGVIPEYLEKFSAGEAEYQDDEKWYDLVLQGERAKSPPTPKGGGAGGVPPIIDGEDDPEENPVDQGEGNTEEGPGEGGDDEATTEENETANIEKDLDLSRDYELHILPNKPRIKVEAFRHLGNCLEKPFKVQPDGYNFKFDYWLNTPYFEESLETPEDCLIMDLASHFLILSNESTRQFPIAFIARKIREKYFQNSLTDVSSSADEAGDILTQLRRHYHDNLQDEAPIDIKSIDNHQVSHIRSRALNEDQANDEEVDQIIKEGKFAKYVQQGYLIRLVELWPSIVTDDKFFTIPYSSVSEDLSKKALIRMLAALDDLRWLVEEGSSAVSKDMAWRLQYSRCLASLRLVESWRVV